jgi:hypothetical protein
MKGYFKYLIEKLKKGNYNTGLLMIIVLIIYTIILFIGIYLNNRSSY